jgi:ADP-ribose pyrophosphatase YjhB (NUDIX family)
MSQANLIRWARELQTIAQAGFSYTLNPFDLERYHQIQKIAAEILSAGSTLKYEQVIEILEAEKGYATPKLDVRGVVFRGDELLFVKELSDGGWTLPGGWVDVNEGPRQAAEREVWEESGYRVRATRLLGVYDRNRHGFPPYIFHTYKLFIECELLGGEATTSIETGGAEFFSENSLPNLSVARTTPELITRVFEHHRHPEWRTDLD